MKDIKRSLIASGLSIAICVVLLAGNTFAWFTDNISNTGNTITAGILSMQAFAYDMAGEEEAYGAEVAVGGEVLKFKNTGLNMEDAEPAIAQANIQVNKLYAELLEVKNNGTLDFKYRLSFMTDDRGLGDALKFDIIEIDENGALSRGPSFKPFEELKSTELVNESMEAGTSKKYIFLYKTDDYDDPSYFEEHFADCEFIFDICIDMAQKDGEFADISKEEPLTGDISNQSDFDEVIEMIKRGRSAEVNIKGDMNLDDILNIKSGQKVVLNIDGGKSVSINNQLRNRDGFDNINNNNSYTDRAAVTVEEGAVLEIKGSDGDLKGTIKTDDYKAIDVKKGGTALIDGVSIHAENTYKDGICAVYSEGNLTVKNAGIEAKTDNDLKTSSGNPQGGSRCCGIYVADGTLIVDGCDINVTGATNQNTGNDAVGIYINGANTELINNTLIKATGEGNSQKGIYLFRGTIGTISGVNADIKGTALYIGSTVGEIRNSVFKGVAYSIYNGTDTTVDISNGVTADGETSGVLKQ